MSFSSNVKEELCEIVPSARHCCLAELSAIVSLCGRIEINAADEYRLFIHTENDTVARKFFTILQKAFNISSEVSVRRLKNSNLYTVYVGEAKDALRVLKATRLLDESGDIREDLSLISNIIIQQVCCKRAFLRGAFLAAGSISDPEKGYHFEIVTPDRPKAEQVAKIIASFDLDAKVAPRKNHHIVYLKEGEQISDILNIMGAHVSLMALENVRILKEVRNSVNRQVNCETANLGKTVKAATRQVEDIIYIRDNMGFENLPEGLEEVANLRLAYPDSSLIELTKLLGSPIGKSGMNHRLKKLSRIAQDLRGEKEENLC
ncbi:MAG: DNA-binding protein WhiA [Lachnospiraceae bacterium]|nr:DNA-binding protein WhiA [Lachnospiraceae bacterium]